MCRNEAHLKIIMACDMKQKQHAPMLHPSPLIGCSSHCPQEEAARATREVAYNMKQRVRQELAFPAVVHFYSWLLAGAAPFRHVASWS